jgi:hypothetical protein
MIRLYMFCSEHLKQIAKKFAADATRHPYRCCHSAGNRPLDRFAPRIDPGIDMVSLTASPNRARLVN